MTRIHVFGLLILLDLVLVLTVPYSESAVVTTRDIYADGTEQPGPTYGVIYRGTFLKHLLSDIEIPSLLIKNKPVNADIIKGAFYIAGYTDVKVSEINIEEIGMNPANLSDFR